MRRIFATSLSRIVPSAAASAAADGGTRSTSAAGGEAAATLAHGRLLEAVEDLVPDDLDLVGVVGA